MDVIGAFFMMFYGRSLHAVYEYSLWVADISFLCLYKFWRALVWLHNGLSVVVLDLR